MISRAFGSEIAIGSRDSGRIESFTCSYGTRAVEPQNWQLSEILPGSNTEMALQLWHCTGTLSTCHPRALSGMDRSAVTRSCSTMTVLSSCCWSSTGDSVPQYGQINACLAG